MYVDFATGREADTSNQQEQIPKSGKDRFWQPWDVSLLRAVLYRIGVVVGAAVVIGLGHDLPRWVLFPIAGAAGAFVLWVWRKTRKRRKRWQAYLIYGGAIAVGLAMLRSGQATRDLGVPPPVAVFGGLGAVLAGAAALLSIARGSRIVRRRLAIYLELAMIVVVLATSWLGFVLFGRAGGSRVAAYVLLAVAAVGLYVVLSLLSESLLVHKQEIVASDEPGGPDRMEYIRVEPQHLEISSWLFPAAALLIVVLGIVWLVAWVNFNATVVVAVAILLVLLFVAVAADGVADMVAVLVVVSLSWSLAPRTDEFRTAPLAAGQTALVALGDSYISGEGATRFFEGTNDKRVNECRRAPSAYAPQLVERTTDPELTGLVFLACSGAKAADLDARVQYEGEPIGSPPRLRDNGVWERGATQLEQFDEVLRAVRPRATAPTDDPEQNLHGLVLISLGGNDAGFGKIASSCVGLGDCGDIVEGWTADLGLVASRLERVYAALRTVIGPHVPVLVVPYPVPLAEDRCDVSPMTQPEHTSLRTFVERLNARVEQAARDAGFHYLDIQPAFEGHRICDTDNADDWYLNYIATNPTGGSLQTISNPRNWFHNSFHPNAKGHRAIADTIETWMSKHRDEITASRFEVNDSPFRLAYLAPDGPRPSELLERIGSGSCSVHGPGWEGDWTACETAKVGRRLLVPGLLFVLAAWLLAFTLLHFYRRAKDPREAPNVEDAKA